MSTLAKLTFAGACVFTVSAMGYVHYRQIEDRYLLHQGIVRDMEARQKRKVENQYNLQTQIDITRRLKEHRMDDETSQSES